MTISPATFVSRPTPVEPAPRLAAALGLNPGDLWVKRDDLIGLGGGGNKVRKLEVTMTEAFDRRATTVITTGAPQSNHARLTAAAGARLGMHVILVLDGPEPAVDRGNVLLDRLFGAEIIWSGNRDPEQVADDHTSSLRGEVVYRIPFGGSSPASATAYTAAGLELERQLPDIRHVVVAVGSGGTMAGLVAALGPKRVLGVASGAVADSRATVATLLTDMGDGAAVDAAALRIDDNQIGRGYDHLSDATRSAVELAARTGGLLLDPTYTGRAMAGLADAVTFHMIQPGQRTVFLHTGGTPGLFGHPEW